MTFDGVTFTRHLESETAELHAFIELLRAEQSALVHGDTDQVAALVEPKARHTLELSRLDQERARWLAGEPANASTGNQTARGRGAVEKLLLTHAGTAGSALAAWRQLMKLAETARHLNTTNGLLIASRLQNTQRALGALFSAARLPGAYGADGGTVSLRTAQQLAVA